MRCKNLHKFQVNQGATFLIVGLARSGTSLVAGVLHYMGVHMGDASLPPNFEDRVSIDKLLSNDLAQAAEILDRYNQHPLWGMKSPPASLKMLIKWRRFRNPIVIRIKKPWRDVAKRRANTYRIPLLLSYFDTAIRLAILKLGFFLFRPPMIELSFQKLVSEPLLQLADFQQRLNLELLDIDAGAAFIAEGNDAYEAWVEKTSQDYKGCIDTDSGLTLTGWVFHKKKCGSVMLEAHLNGVQIATTRADIKRPDVLSAHKHRYGHLVERSGFRLEASEEIDWKLVEIYAQNNGGLEKLYLTGIPARKQGQTTIT